MLYSPSIQHAKNTNLMVQCEECSKWRLIFAKKKLTIKQLTPLQDNVLSEISSTCGFLFDDIQLPHGVNVHVKDHDCADQIDTIRATLNKFVFIVESN